MKRKILTLTGILLLTAGMLILGGCKDADEENEIDAGLVGSWSNNQSGDDLKTFKINSDGSFTATLTATAPGIEGAGEQGTVTGVLVKEGSDYMMNKMEETTGKSWGSAVGNYNRTYVQITLSDNNKTFELKCKDVSIVESFFGGTYYKQ